MAEIQAATDEQVAKFEWDVATCRGRAPHATWNLDEVEPIAARLRQDREMLNEQRFEIADLKMKSSVWREDSNPGDIRAAGWMVAVHNDYMQNGRLHTFWLFTNGDRCVKGEGFTDAEALTHVRQQIGLSA